MAPKKQARELLNLQVSAVALVDEPANLRPFFVVKRTNQTPATTDGETLEDPDMGKIKKQAQVVAEDAVAGALEGLTLMAEQSAAFAEILAGKTPQDGMVILTEEDLAPWREAVAAATGLESALTGGGEADMADPEADAAAEDEMRMAKDVDGEDGPSALEAWQTKSDERMDFMEQALTEILVLLKPEADGDPAPAGDLTNGADLTADGAL